MCSLPQYVCSLQITTRGPLVVMDLGLASPSDTLLFVCRGWAWHPGLTGW